MGLIRKIRKRLTIRRRLEPAPPLLIYQMGKVGSSSLKASLAPMWPGLTIHVHSITKDLEKRKKGVNLVYERVIRKAAPLFIISPVREPLGRNVSAFFQNFKRVTGVNYKDSIFSTEELIRIFLQKFNHDMALTWFDRHLKPALDIDVYNYEFPSTGVQVIHHGNRKLLLMRSELPDSVKQSAVRDFLNMPNFLLSNANIGLQKEYGETYNNFREAFIPPDWLITRMYESRFFNHFYDSTQKDTLIGKWTKKQLASDQNSTSVLKELP